jgi:hypothetical protein
MTCAVSGAGLRAASLAGEVTVPDGYGRCGKRGSCPGFGPLLSRWKRPERLARNRSAALVQLEGAQRPRRLPRVGVVEAGPGSGRGGSKQPPRGAPAASKRSLHETVPIARRVLACKVKRPDRLRELRVAGAERRGFGPSRAADPGIVVPGRKQGTFGIQLQLGAKGGELLDPSAGATGVDERLDRADRSRVGGYERCRLAA